jgi:CRISPR-associated protein Cmx8
VSKTRAAEAAESLTVRYDLSDMPTAQHKAGLAGLILQIRHMGQPERGFSPDQVPFIEDLTPTSATIRFNAKSVQALFDDLYDASVERVRVKSKWQGAEPVEVVEEEETDAATGKAVRVKKFVYEVVQPRGHFLRQHLPHDMDRDRDWHKLWRDMLWAIPRGTPRSRIPFQQRAANPKQPCREGAAAWDDLLAVERARRKNDFHTAEVAGSLWLGAQAQNAEAVPFRGRSEQNLLLHFWPLTALIFVPQRIDNEGKGKFAGYSLAVPEVAHLEYFCEDYLQLLHNLGREVRGFRPAEAVIDLPAQAALEFMAALARVAAHVVGTKDVRDDVTSVEYLHLVKVGNNVKSMAAGRVAPNPDLMERYLAFAGSPGRPSPYRNPLFRAALLLAMLRDLDWYACLGRLFAERPWPFFVRSGDTPRNLPWFAADAAAKFQSEWEKYKDKLEVYDVTAKQNPDAGQRPVPNLPLLVHRLVRAYVQRKTEEKSGEKWEDFKDRKKTDEAGRERVDVPQAYLVAREKIASGIFLELRSRREQDFVEHFTATFCSIPQFLREDDFRAVAEALLTRPDDVKTLTLLALSANS